MPDTGYEVARAITARAGRTYYLASALLPPPRRRAVFALYAFARMADDIVDGDGDAAAKSAALDALSEGLRNALSGEPVARLAELHAPEPHVTGLHVTDVDPRQPPVLTALADTVARFEIDVATFDAFLTSMRMDLPGAPEFRNRYRTWDELAEYTYGSAAVIGLQMLPILGVCRGSAPGDVRYTGERYADIASGAALLGDAFQLTNFLRDLGEDLDRGRIYLPTDELAVFGVDEDSLCADRAAARPSPALRRALGHVAAVNRDQYRRARPAIDALPPRTRPAIAAAARSYADILTEIERSDFNVLSRRAVVPVRRRLGHAVGAFATAGRSRR